MTQLENNASAIVDAIEAAVEVDKSAVALSTEQVATLRQFLFVSSYRKRSRFSQDLEAGNFHSTVREQVKEHMKKYGEADEQDAFFHSMIHIMDDSPSALLHDSAILPIDRALFFRDCQERRLAIYIAPQPYSFICTENGFGLCEDAIRLLMPWSILTAGAIGSKERYECCILFPISPRILIMLLPPTSHKSAGRPPLYHSDLPTIGDLWPATYFSDLPTAQYPYFMSFSNGNTVHLKLQPLSSSQLSTVNAYLLEHCQPSTKVAYKSSVDVYNALLVIKNDLSLPLNFPRDGRPEFAMLKDYGYKYTPMPLKGGGWTTSWRWVKSSIRLLWPMIVWYGIYRLAEKTCRVYLGLSVFQAGGVGLSTTVGTAWTWTWGLVTGWISFGSMWSLVKKAAWYGPWVLGVVAIVARFF